MAMNGTDLLVLVNIGTDEAPSYMAVGCQRDATIEETLALIDVSCKEERTTRVLPGRSTGTITLDALYIPDDQAFAALKSATRNGDLILIAREEAGVVTETVPVMVTSLSESFPDQDAATISVGMTISGAWEAVGS